MGVIWAGSANPQVLILVRVSSFVLLYILLRSDIAEEGINGRIFFSGNCKSNSTRRNNIISLNQRDPSC